MNRRMVAGVVVALTVIGGVWWWSTRETGARGLTASGTLEATEADLAFVMAGRVDAIGPAEGDRVARGDTVARLEAAELRAHVSGAEAAAASARAGLTELQRGARPEERASARAALAAAAERAAQAEREVERARRLHAGGAISNQALEQAETAWAAAAAAREQAEQAAALTEQGPRPETIEAQRARVLQAEAQLEGARERLAQAVLTAPRDGIVTVRHREPGETVFPGAPILTLLDPMDRWVRIYVRADRMGEIRLGQPAEIRIDAFPERSWRGEVVFIGSEAEFTPRNVQTPEERTQLVYPVKVRVTDDPEGTLKPGLPADVRLLAPGGAEGL